ncbi:MAG: hypothetical protein H6838_08230 [Planctomycetes bacterium]|nr:hypothetical protein [Planctomycetota bacterium]
MNLVLTWCGKEWRAQRPVLLGYTLLVFACLCLGLSLAPKRAWFGEGFGVHALSWFVTAGILGVVAFVAPALVRAEQNGRDDQFARRLPGALWPAFGGKLLFLVLATLALPLLGLAVGELFLLAWGQDWHGLVWETDAGIRIQWPAEVVGAAGALLLVPWIWAVGTWLPSGRMALGGTALLTLLVGVCVTAVLRQYPKIEAGIAWQWLLWFVPVLGLAVAAISWSLGRRGGGALRSARLGLAAAACGLVPPSLWLADRAASYRHPDPARLVKLDVQGLSPDARYVLARGAENAEWYGANFRIDLQTGAAEEVSSFDRAFTGELLRPDFWAFNGTSRFWRGYGEQGRDQLVLDLRTMTTTPVDYDRQAHAPALPADLREQVLAERREHTPLRAPDGQRVWLEQTTLCYEESDGSVTRQEVPELADALLMPRGHGIALLGAKNRMFDLTQRRLLPEVMARGSGYLVRGAFVCSSDREKWLQWSQRDPGGESQLLTQLNPCSVLGLFDDDHLLVASRPSGQGASGRLFLYRPADRVVTELTLPGDLPAGCTLDNGAPAYVRSSLLPRDPGGGVWVVARRATDLTFLRLDAATREVTRVLACGTDEASCFQMLAWPDANSALVRRGAQILELDWRSGASQVLFPRR